MDYKQELQEIINLVESAKNRLAEVTEVMDLDDREVDSLDEALDDAIDIMTDSVQLVKRRFHPENGILNFEKLI